MHPYGTTRNAVNKYEADRPDDHRGRARQGARRECAEGEAVHVEATTAKACRVRYLRARLAEQRAIRDAATIRAMELDWELRRAKALPASAFEEAP